MPRSWLNSFPSELSRMSDDNNPAMADASVEHSSHSKVALGQPHLTISRISQAIQELREKGGSTVSSISKLLRTRGMKTRLVDLKKLLIRGVETGEITRAQINRFLLKAISTFRSTALNRKRRRSCGRGRRGKSGKGGKGKKPRGGGKRRSKKAKKGKAKKGKAKKGKAKEGKAKKGRRRPRRRGGKR